MWYDKYEVLEILGKGGGSVVYKVRELALGRTLAVKEIPLKQADCLEYTKEEQILKECFHPALPIVLDGFREENAFYLVMEYIDGMTLKEYIVRQRKFSEQEAVAFACQLADVLIYLHTRVQPVIYGDLKPENIMVTKEGKLRLIDFGTALYVEEQVQREGTYGSLGYASPEQKQGRGAGISSDIYSLGALLHYMLTGEDPCKPPYIRRKLRECNGALSGELERIICCCLKEEPFRRYQTAERLLKELQNYRKNSFARKCLFALKGCIPLLFCLTAIFFYLKNQVLCGVLFAAFGVIVRLILQGHFGGTENYCIEKNIWRTDKRGIGFFVLLFLSGAVLFESAAEAKPLTQDLPVTIYDASGYKLCLKEDSVYQLQGEFRIEIPKECFTFEETRTVTIQILGENQTVVGERQFQVQRRK